MPGQEPPRAEKLPTRIARAIARDVAAQRLPVGTVLTDEKAMAAEFGVGRNTVREALRLLEAQGLVELRRGVGGGPVVAAPSGDTFGKTMTMFLQMQGTSFDQLAVALAAVEGVVASQVAARAAGGERFDALVDVLHHEDLFLHVDPPPPDVDPFSVVGIDFHRALRGYLDNDVIALVIEGIEGIWIDRTRFLRDDRWGEADRARVHHDHVLIFDAVRRGDGAEAARVMSHHIMHEVEDLRRLQPKFLDAVIDWR